MDEIRLSNDARPGSDDNPQANNDTVTLDLHDRQPSTRTDDDVIPLPTWRRWATLFTVCWMPIPMTFAVSSIFATANEVAADLSVSLTAITYANAGAYLAMAFSTLLWVPLVKIMGRRPGYITATISLCACSIAEALAPDMGTFATVWIISGATGTVFLISGQSIIADVFVPVCDMFPLVENGRN